MMWWLNKHRKVLIFVYICFTIFKFFSMRIDIIREEDPTICLKLYPTIGNVIFAFEEGDFRTQAEYERKYPWYEEEQYLEIFHTGGNNGYISFYDGIITAWWLLSAALIVGFFIYFIRKIFNINSNV